MYSVNEWVKIKYLLWILNTNYCVPDENYSRKHIFRVWFVSFEEAKKRPNIYSLCRFNKCHTVCPVYNRLNAYHSLSYSSPKQLFCHAILPTYRTFNQNLNCHSKKIKQFSWVTFQISKNTDAVLIFFLTPDIDDEFIY